MGQTSEGTIPRAKIQERYNCKAHTGLLQTGFGVVEEPEAKAKEFKEVIKEFESYKQAKVKLKHLEVSFEKPEEKEAQKRKLEFED